MARPRDHALQGPDGRVGTPTPREAGVPVYCSAPHPCQRRTLSLALPSVRPSPPALRGARPSAVQHSAHVHALSLAFLPCTLTPSSLPCACAPSSGEVGVPMCSSTLMSCHRRAPSRMLPSACSSPPSPRGTRPSAAPLGAHMRTCSAPPPRRQSATGPHPPHSKLPSPSLSTVGSLRLVTPT